MSWLVSLSVSCKKGVDKACWGWGLVRVYLETLRLTKYEEPETSMFWCSQGLGQVFTFGFPMFVHVGSRSKKVQVFGQLSVASELAADVTDAFDFAASAPNNCNSDYGI